MFAISPSLPAPYRWLNAPLNALSPEHWSGHFPPLSWSTISSIDSACMMIPLELRQTLLRRPELYARTQWPLTILATATAFVTSAMALYYYAQRLGIDLSVSQILASLTPDGESFFASGIMPDFASGFIPEFASGIMPDLYDADEQEDDDEHVDPELLDGLDPNHVGNYRVVLTSSDPSSDLCHCPLELNLGEGKTSQTRSTTPMSEKDDFNDDPFISTPSPCRPDLSPSILRRGRQTFRTGSLGDPALPNCNRMRKHSSRGAHQTPSPFLSPSAVDDVRTFSLCSTPLSETSTASSETCTSTRAIVIREPDWSPFTETHSRAKQRALVASLASALHGDMRDGGTDEADPFTGEIWFERFTKSTAAAGRQWDWRRRHRNDFKDRLVMEMDSGCLSPRTKGLDIGVLNDTIAGDASDPTSTGANLGRSASMPGALKRMNSPIQKHKVSVVLSGDGALDSPRVRRALESQSPSCFGESVDMSTHVCHLGNNMVI